MHFTKMQGLGNDYIYIYGTFGDPVSVSRAVSDRHFGIGSDGLILIGPSDIADFSMRIFNADGSEARMCGNGIRCVGKYVYDHRLTDKKQLSIETLSGIKYLTLSVSDRDLVDSVSVEMGQVLVGEPIQVYIGSETITGTKVNMGNPHFVCFTEQTPEELPARYGKPLQNHSEFPDGVNAEFVQCLDRNVLRMRVWERGSGITMACGTGACAAAAAAVVSGRCEMEKPITVVLDGGELEIVIRSDHNVLMKGPAVTVCEGEWEPC